MDGIGFYWTNARSICFWIDAFVCARCVGCVRVHSDTICSIVGQLNPARKTTMTSQNIQGKNQSRINRRRRRNEKINEMKKENRKSNSCAIAECPGSVRHAIKAKLEMRMWEKPRHWVIYEKMGKQFMHVWKTYNLYLSIINDWQFRHVRRFHVQREVDGGSFERNCTFSIPICFHNSLMDFKYCFVHIVFHSPPFAISSWVSREPVSMKWAYVCRTRGCGNHMGNTKSMHILIECQMPLLRDTQFTYAARRSTLYCSIEMCVRVWKSSLLLAYVRCRTGCTMYVCDEIRQIPRSIFSRRCSRVVFFFLLLFFLFFAVIKFDKSRN